MIATYGNPHWKDTADRAALSVSEPAEVLVGHQTNGTLSTSRNGLADRATSEWLCFLDADDELAPGYLGAMKRAYERERDPSPDGLLLAPAVFYRSGVRKGRGGFPNEMDIRDGNWLCIGTLVRRSLFWELGGFRDYPLYEDWDLWGRCVNAGARIVKVPDALYIANVRTGSRNRVHSQAERHYWHHKIGHENWPDHYAEPVSA